MQRDNKISNEIYLFYLFSYSGTYAYSANREWECDSKVPEHLRNSFKDISLQLVENSPGKNFNVIFGGGRLFLGQSFILFLMYKYFNINFS